MRTVNSVISEITWKNLFKFIQHNKIMEIWAPPTWAVIHSYPTTYKQKSTKDKEKMKRLIILVTLLLCCMECRNNAKKELKKLPIDKYLKNNETIFLWAWTLHDDVNRRLGKKQRSYQEVKDWYFSRVGMFGGSIWRMLHSFAVTYTPDLAEEYKELVELLIYFACSEKWKKLGEEALSMCPIDKYLKTNEAIFNWSYRFHNYINLQLGKTSPDYQKTKDWYFLQLSSDYSVDGKCKSCSV